jgi:hypothetical protein
MTNEIQIGELARATGDTFKFENVGDTLAGTITQVMEPFDRVNMFNEKPEKVYAIGITPDGGTEQQIIWPVRTERGPSALLEAIVSAVIASGSKSYAVGGRLAVAHHELKDVGKPQKMKLYKAKYTPPAPAAGIVDLDDLLA